VIFLLLPPLSFSEDSALGVDFASVVLPPLPNADVPLLSVKPRCSWTF